MQQLSYKKLSVKWRRVCRGTDALNTVWELNEPVKQIFIFDFLCLIQDWDHCELNHIDNSLNCDKIYGVAYEMTSWLSELLLKIWPSKEMMEWLGVAAT